MDADEGVTLYLEAGVEALLNGKPAPAVVALKKAERTVPGQPAAQPDKIRVGRVEFHLHESGDRLALRVRDPESPIRIGFQGPRWFPVSESARVLATLKPFETPRVVDVRNILGDNEPYSGRFPVGYSIPFHAARARLPHITFEIRQYLIDTGETAAALAERLAEVLRQPLSDRKLYALNGS